jgi:DNA-binding CsgD family transcriptional regulator
MSPLASAREAERRHIPEVLSGAHRVGLDLDDAALAGALRRAIAVRPGLVETGLDRSDVVVTDRPAEADGVAAHDRVLRVGVSRAGRNSIESLEPGLILGAASLIASGYDLTRREPREGQAGAPTPHLSQRERQVAELLVDGASNKVIARALDISVHTAKFHVTAILDKLGARNRADAVAMILREGLVAL